MKFWTTTEMRLVRSYYMTHTDAQLANMLNRSENSVKGFRWRNKLMRPMEFGQFKKGSTPWNKGISYDAKGNSHKTRFAKGHQPKNTKQNYHISVRKDTKSGSQYQYIRTDVNKWELLHRYIWELENGPIPAAHIIIFEDKNTMNCQINNLRCITRSQHMVRNQNREKQSISLKKSWNWSRTKETFGIKTNRHNYFKVC